MTFAPALPTRRHMHQMGLAAVVPRTARAATPKDTLVLAAAFDDIISLDPAESFEFSAGELMGNAYERLVKLDAIDPSKLSGDLARVWTVSADGKGFTFELKPQLRFASGNPLTAEDVVFSLQRAVLLGKNPAFILTQFGQTKDTVKQRVRQTGPLSVLIETDKAYAPSFVRNCLSANVAAVVDKRLLLGKEKDGDMGHAWLRTAHAGSGAWKIPEWRANELVTLERNDQYHGVKPTLARVIYRHVKESATQRLLLEKGDADVARNLSPQDIEALAKNEAIQFFSRRPSAPVSTSRSCRVMANRR